MAAVNGYSSNYSYGYGYDSYQNSKINSSSWTENAEQAANKMKEDLGISTSESSSTAKATSSASTFLMEYQTRLEELEAAAAKLQTSKKDNVFSKYEAALAEATKTQIFGSDGTVTNKELDEAEDALLDETK